LQSDAALDQRRLQGASHATGGRAPDAAEAIIALARTTTGSVPPPPRSITRGEGVTNCMRLILILSHSMACLFHDLTNCLRFAERDATSRLVVRRRCQEEDNPQQQQQQQQQQEAAAAAAEGGGADEQEKRTFLSLEEAGLVEMSGLSTHERFLCRLTVRVLCSQPCQCS
jgi:hypothetical protein